METLTLNPHYSVLRSLLAPTRRVPLGAGAVHRRRPYARVSYEFTLRDAQRVQADAESLYSFARRHQGDTAFWYDGGAWGTLSTPVLVGRGDGVTTQFWLPNRTLLDAPAVYVDDVLADPQPITNLVAGELTFLAPVDADSVVTAQYNCRYRVVFWFEGEPVLTEAYFYKRLFSVEGIVLREYPDPMAAAEMTMLVYTSTWELDPEANLTEIYTTYFAH